MSRYDTRVHVGKTIEDCQSIGIRKAQAAGRRRTWKLGQRVAHPSDPIIYGFLGSRGGIATVGLSAQESPSGKIVRKKFPLRELFSPDVALQTTLEEVTLDVAAKFHQP